MSGQVITDRMAALRRTGRTRPPQRPTLGALALDLAQQDPDRPVLTEGTVTLTRASLVDLALRLGGGLVARGLRPGAVVAFQLPNWWEAVVINMATALFGWRIVPLLPGYRASELGVILPACGVDAIFVPAATNRADPSAVIAALPGPTPAIHPLRGPAGPDTFEALITHPPGTPQLAPSDDAKLILFTSGSTGRPKGVIHTHDSLGAACARAIAFWGLGETDRLYVPSPIAHIGGSIYAFEYPWIGGCHAILDDRWDPARAVRRIEGEGITFTAGATPFLRGLLDEAARAGSNLPGLRRFICGGASVPPDLVRAALDRFPNAVVSRAYGSTEVPTSCPGIADRATALQRADTDGQPNAHHRILTPDGTDAPPGAEGEIVVKGPQMLAGYLDPADEAGCFTPDGYFRMGDLGRLVDGQFLCITGRTKDIIIRKGENISPLEVETILLRHPAVAAIAIVGAPDAERGEMAVAFVVPRPGTDFDFAAMTAHLDGVGLARIKYPERLERVDALPMSAVGKVLKPELRRIAAALVARHD